ncbi:hypothetical protein FB45DRAFT_763940 [Roridomyces roridus]|uniref:Uncharacterized protein n=1 Tax=Roridomyces roridus TaxID=1738132 RepID=A0AAD7B238_9AGAR|nr:hypothetical protein FB45DRAFT_763940 [Roridomyces roridus]
MISTRWLSLNSDIRKFIANDKPSNEAAVAEINKVAGQLDVVVASAGILDQFGQTATADPASFLEHYQINTLGFIVLYQAVHYLLLASPSGAPILAYISSMAGSITSYINLHAPAYMGSKAASNFIVRTIDDEDPKLIVFSLHPGWVQTDMGNAGAVANGMEKAPDTLEESISGLLRKIDGATKEGTSGKFLNFQPVPGTTPPTDEILW